MSNRPPSLRALLSLIGASCLFAFSVVAIPVAFIASPASAATVTSGTCTAEVNDATGVSMSVAANGDCVLTFATASSTPTGSSEFATRTWTVPASVSSVDVFVVAGGGGGGMSNGSTPSGGGGGGGGIVLATGVSVTPSSSVTVKTGFGGYGGNCSPGYPGGNSAFGALTAVGGGFGGGCGPAYGGPGGNAGGAHWGQPQGFSNQTTSGTASNGSNITAYGNAGGKSYPHGVSGDSVSAGGGGGGGAAAIGGDSSQPGDVNTGIGGAGGQGIANAWRSGSDIVYGSGGGGQGRGTQGVGGTNAGTGSGTNAAGNPGIDAVDETGAGGGGGYRQGGGRAGDGGSGIVVVRYSIPAPPSNLSLPTIIGTARTGETLTASSPSSSWTGSPTSYSYQWKRSATSTGSYTDIVAATSSSYLVPESDVGYIFIVSVTATNGLGTSGAALSAATTAVVDIAPMNTAIPVVTGVARTGETLISSRGSWTSAPSATTSYTYQWKRANSAVGTYTNITSATNRTYDLTDADIDKFIKVSVIATNSVGASSAVLSSATSVVVDLNDSVVPTASTPISTATGFTFAIQNYSNSYTYSLTTTKGSVSRSSDDVTVTGLTAGESATVTIAVTRSTYKPASKTVTGSAAAALTIVIQAPVTTVAQGQLSVVTVAPTTTTLPVLNANGVPVSTTTTTSTTVAPIRTGRTKNAALPAIVTTTTLGPPVVEKVSAGQTAVQVDGVKTDATVTRENNQMVVNAGSLSATLSGLDSAGKTAPLDSDGNIHLEGGDVIKISLGGFKPGTVVEVWLFSTPTQLGSAVVGADGTVTGAYRLPVGMKSGSHRVVVTTRMANGKPTTFTLGILVGDISTTSTLTRVLIAIPITLAIGFGFLLPTQLRRRRKARPA